MFDLRSDTVTKPNKDIISTALIAELGDDEYGEDKTVNDLQEYCANLLGFEAGLFVTSGLQGNQISLLIHTDPGNEVITLFDSHIKNYEHGAASFLSRIQFRDIDHINGLLDLNTLDLILKKSKVHKPLISCLTLENTHLASGGSIVSYLELVKIYNFAKTNKLNVHIDGARIWHAIIEEKNTQDYGSVCDSLTFCFSKGLGAPIGSMLLGSNDFISKAREYRKILGGGMRQVGVIAAMARKALDNRNDLLNDHNKARKVYNILKNELENQDFISKLTYQGTNMVFLEINSQFKPELFLDELYSNSIIAGLINENTVRLVFHKDINDSDLETISDQILYSSSKF